MECQKHTSSSSNYDLRYSDVFIYLQLHFCENYLSEYVTTDSSLQICFNLAPFYSGTEQTGMIKLSFIVIRAYHRMIVQPDIYSDILRWAMTIKTTMQSYWSLFFRVKGRKKTVQITQGQSLQWYTHKAQDYNAYNDSFFTIHIKYKTSCMSQSRDTPWPMRPHHRQRCHPIPSFLNCVNGYLRLC